MKWHQRLTVGICAALVIYATSCSALEREVRYTDPETGEVIETTVGDEAAKQVEATGGTVSEVVGGVLGTATGNPVIGAGAAAALAALVGAAASKLRRKPPTV